MGLKMLHARFLRGCIYTYILKWVFGCFFAFGRVKKRCFSGKFWIQPERTQNEGITNPKRRLFGSIFWMGEAGVLCACFYIGKYILS